VGSGTVISSYRDLNVWQKSMDLVVDTYKLTENFPSEERFGLTSQIRRSVISIPSNIAEGSGRKGTKEFIQFLWIANASLSEFETQIDIAHRLKFINNTDETIEKIMHIRKMLQGLIRKLGSKSQ
jgi:four helix bundle protein